MNNFVKHRSIKGKDIYMFDSHHYALFPWARLRGNLEQAPILISLDHHTDTREAFLQSCAPAPLYTYDREKATHLLGDISFLEESSIEKAIMKLRNDEHIKTAIGSDIILKAFIISYSNSFDDPPSQEQQRQMKNLSENMIKRVLGIEFEEESIKRPYTYPDSDIYMPGISSDKLDLGSRELIDYAIETEFLEEKFQVFSEMGPLYVKEDGTLKKKYILDIDLDYFHTIKSICPDNPEIFYRLIKNAEIVTIALEPECIELLKEEYDIKEDINSSTLLNALLNHIEKALG